jgi:pseudaminic acid synthase
MLLGQFLGKYSNRTFVVAEVSGNHAGNIDNCIQLIHAAKYAGADAVKFQTYTPDTLTLNSNSEDFLIPPQSPWSTYVNQYSLYSEAHTPWQWHPELFKIASDLELIPFSSPFDESAVDFLETLGCPIYKLASPEINHIPLIRRIAKTGKPIIISLGVATESELEKAVEVFSSNSSAEIAILQCDTSYPADPENANLNQLEYLKQKFGKIIGYSDHTLGSTSAVVAVALGARIIEKHIRIESSDDSPDSFFSTEREDFKHMVHEIRKVEKLFGGKVFRQQSNSKDFSIRRSIYPARDLTKGEVITTDSLKIVRPGYGISPEFLADLQGRKVNRNVLKGERITLEDFEGLDPQGLENK